MQRMSTSLFTRVWPFLVATTVAPLAHAIPDFPPEVMKVFEMPCEPACTLCHDSLKGGEGTVVQLFGKFYYDLQLLDTDNLASIQDVRVNAERFSSDCPDAPTTATGYDADCDGLSDVEELAAGSNPNETDPDASICIEGVEYGCVGSVAPRAARVSGEGGALLFATLFGLSVFVRRRRRA